ncbi:MAG: UDP-N-acetylglucosamine 2-epimerase (non-hydrolyzing) [Vicinamibacteraceae bacterium]
MPKVVHVVGARPNFIKAAPVMAALERGGGITQRLIHTGQHYDDALSRVFFDELRLPRPDQDLGVGSGTHAAQTAAVLLRLEPILVAERPDLVVVIGDVNSTLAAALVAAKLGIPVAHLEAGLRSFDRRMPEETNRVVADHLSALLLAPTDTAAANLAREGLPPAAIATVGNVAIDTLLAHRAGAPWDDVRRTLSIEDRRYAVLTLHRPSNVDDPGRLRALLEEVVRAAGSWPVLFPVHPRTARQLAAAGLEGAGLEGAGLDGAGLTGSGSGLRVCDPLGYRAFVALMDHAACVFTDSGGIQAETTVLGVPCLTLRDTTEWPETTSSGTNTLVGTDLDMLGLWVAAALGEPRASTPIPSWDGHAADRAADAIRAWLAAR